MSFVIHSTAFGDGQENQHQKIPRRHTGQGEDVSPALAWEGVPDGTREFSVIVDDPDAPTPQPWVHWVLYKIPPDVTQLAEGVPGSSELTDPPGAVQGVNSWPTVGYRGPMPPAGHGVHHYHFRLYALDTELAVKPGLDKAALLAAMKGHVLAETELVGTYEISR